MEAKFFSNLVGLSERPVSVAFRSFGCPRVNTRARKALRHNQSPAKWGEILRVLGKSGNFSAGRGIKRLALP